MTSSSPLFILYGSATGNAEHIAKDLAASYATMLQQKNPNEPTTRFTSVVCCELDQFKKKCVPTWECPPTAPGATKYGVLIITSTTGNGDPPENASRFVRLIKRKTNADSENNMFRHVAYAVLGLGDTNYDKFCECGKVVDRRIEELGGMRARTLACADEATGLEDVVEPWVKSIFTDITNVCFAREQDKASPTHYCNGTNGMGPLSTTTPIPEIPKVPETMIAVSSPSSSEHPKGVSTLRALLGLTGSDPLWVVDPTCLPSLSSCRSSCELVTEDEHRHPMDNGDRKVRSESVADSYSTTSSAGYHYNFHRPFEATIMKARYLTNTPLDAAKLVANILLQQDKQSDRNGASMKQAAAIFDEYFPLKNTEHAERNGKRVIELTLQLPDDYTLEYAPGDSLGLVVENTEAAVLFVLNMLQEYHQLGREQKIMVDGNHPITVEEAVRTQIDLCAPISNKRTLVALSQFASDPTEALALQLLASKTTDGERLFATYIEEQRRSVYDLMHEFPSIQSIPLSGLLGILPSIPPRYYSVSSSPIEHRRLSLTIAFSVVDYLTPSCIINGEDMGLRRVHGIATRYLEAIATPLLAGKDSAIAKVKIFPKPTAEFRMPSTLSTPLVLIGPGTGIAPFIGFLAHRRVLIQQGDSVAASQAVVEGTWRGGYHVDDRELSLHAHDASGLNTVSEFRKSQGVGSVDVFFGCRYQDHDWLYREELEEFANQGVATVHVAFSREGVKEYVQHVMKRHSDHLSKLLTEQSAAVYVCGDGNAMAKDVKEALIEILGSSMSGGIDEASEFLEKMKKEKRYLLDIWS